MSVDVQFTGRRPNQESFFYSVMKGEAEIARLYVAFLARAFPHTISFEKSAPNVIEGLRFVYGPIADENPISRSNQANELLGIWGSKEPYEDRQIAATLADIQYATLAELRR